MEKSQTGTRLLCLLFFSLSYLCNPQNLDLATQKGKKKHYESRFPIVFLYFCFVVPEGYSSSWFASCMPLAVAVMIVSSLLPISSSRLSSCRRWVDLSTSLSGKKN